MFEIGRKINSLTLEILAKKAKTMLDMFPPTIYDQYGRIIPLSSPLEFKVGDTVEVRKPYRFTAQ